MGLSAAAPWLKYYGNTPASLEYPHKTMYEMVEAAAKRHPNHVAYVFMGKKTTYAEFMKRIQAAAQGLYKMGIRKGDKVTICMANTPQALDCSITRWRRSCPSWRIPRKFSLPGWRTSFPPP